MTDGKGGSHRRTGEPSRRANGATAAEDAGVRIIVCYPLGRGRCVPKPSSRYVLGSSTLAFGFLTIDPYHNLGRGLSTRG